MQALIWAICAAQEKTGGRDEPYAASLSMLLSLMLMLLSVAALSAALCSLACMLLSGAALSAALDSLLLVLFLAVAHSAAMVLGVWCRSAPGRKLADCGRSVPALI